MKKCSKCGEEKAEAEFNKRSDRRGRFKSQCKLCEREGGRIANRKHRASNREKILKRRKEVRRRNLKKYRKKGREDARKNRPARKAYEDKTRERRNMLARLRHTRNPECRRKISRRHYKNMRKSKKKIAERNLKQKEHYRRSPEARLRRLYKLTLEQFDEMILNQGGMCAICSKSCKLVVDHDHESKKVRGLLCPTCNQGIGLLRDSSAVAQLAANYLKTNGK